SATGTPVAAVPDFSTDARTAGFSPMRSATRRKLGTAITSASAMAIRRTWRYRTPLTTSRTGSGLQIEVGMGNPSSPLIPRRPRPLLPSPGADSLLDPSTEDVVEVDPFAFGQGTGQLNGPGIEVQGDAALGRGPMIDDADERGRQLQGNVCFVKDVPVVDRVDAAPEAGLLIGRREPGKPGRRTHRGLVRVASRSRSVMSRAATIRRSSGPAWRRTTSRNRPWLVAPYARVRVDPSVRR